MDVFAHLAAHERAQRRRRRALAVALLALAAAAGGWWTQRSPAGPVVAHGTPTSVELEPWLEPDQVDLAPDEAAPIAHVLPNSTWTLTPRARFVVDARVLCTLRYDGDAEDVDGELAPIDVGLGWGPLADADRSRWIAWGQSGRWIYSRWEEEPPISPAEVTRSHANVHAIPANENVRAALFALVPDTVVRLEGLLVDVDGSEVPHLFRPRSRVGVMTRRSSLRRDDTGDGACEVLFVRRLVADGLAYE